MASKTALASSADGQNKPQIVEGALGAWANFTGFLTDVRSEMRKVVAPSWKEVQATTTVVIAAVFIFGAFFFVADGLFKYGVNALLNKLGGMQ